MIDYNRLNWLIDEVMPKVDGNAYKIILCVARKTWGWGKASDRISLSQFQEMTGIRNRTNVSRAIQAALESKYIKRKKSGQYYIYAMKTSTESVPATSTESVPVETNQYRISTRTSTESVPELVPNQYPQIEKRNIKKDNSSGRVFSTYADNIGGLTPIIAESIGDAIDEHGESWVMDAIQEAAKNGVRKWSYISAILDNWQRDGRGNGKPAQNGEAWDRLLTLHRKAPPGQSFRDWGLTECEMEAVKAIGGPRILDNMTKWDTNKVKAQYLQHLGGLTNGATTTA